MHLVARAPEVRPAPVDSGALDEHLPGWEFADADVLPGRVRCTTGIRRRPLGRASFTVVRPFHRRIVPAVLERAARHGWTSRG